MIARGEPTRFTQILAFHAGFSAAAAGASITLGSGGGCVCIVTMRSYRPLRAMSSSCVPTSTMRPFSITTMRCACAIVLRRCAITKLEGRKPETFDFLGFTHSLNAVRLFKVPVFQQSTVGMSGLCTLASTPVSEVRKLLPDEWKAADAKDA